MENRPDATRPKPGGGFPAYAFVPSSGWPHPRSDSRGHSHGLPTPKADPIVTDDWKRSRTYLRGCALFNAGYYWEAHEAWEALWHAHERRGVVATVLKGLIKLAACGVKIRQRQSAGAMTHARRAAESMESVITQGVDHMLGLDLRALRDIARSVEASLPRDPLPVEAAVSRVFDWRIDPN